MKEDSKTGDSMTGDSMNMANMTLDEEKQAQRHRYMATKELSHQQYYEWLAGRIGLTTDHVKSWIGEDAIKRSKDRAFNDIPLAQWDALHNTVVNFAAQAGTGGKFWWSLSESVSCLKALARVVRGPHPDDDENYRR